MKLKPLVAAVLIAAGFASPAPGQTSSYVPPAATTAGGITSDQLGSQPQTAPTSRWVTPTTLLCASDGVSPPIGAEIYVYTGASFPIGSEYLGGELNPGWVIGGGLRTLFFNQTMTAAWVVETGINHFYNTGRHQRQFPLIVIDFTGDTLPNGNPEVARIQFGTPIRPGLVIRDTDRTFVNCGIGRDWYWRGAADEPDTRKCRFGIDTGARYGTLSQEYDRIKHRTDVIGGFYVGAHQDIECPSKWGILVFGLRSEYSYTWSDILQTQSNIQEINVMMTVGIRY